MNTKVSNVIILFCTITIINAQINYEDREDGYENAVNDEAPKTLDELKPVKDHHPHHQNVGYHHHHPNRDTHSHPSTNLLNVQTLNLILKHNNLLKRLKPKDVNEQILRDGDRLCKKSGRCGCPGDRCGDNSKELQEESENDGPLRCTTDRCGPGRSSQQLRCTGDRCENHYEHSLRCSGNRCGCSGKNPIEYLRCQYERAGIDRDLPLGNYGKRIKINDNLDAIVVDMKNIDPLLEYINRQCKGDVCKMKSLNNIVDVLDEKNSYNNDGDGLEAEVSKLESVSNDDLVEKINNMLPENTSRTLEKLTLDDLAKFYANIRNDSLKALTAHVLGENKNTLDLRYLSADQKDAIEVLKQRVHSDPKVNRQKIAEDLDNIVFNAAEQLPMVIPHTLGVNVIYVPNWLFNMVRNQKDLRSYKSPFPLTKLQKLKLQKNFPNIIKKQNTYHRRRR